jgi:ATP-dependent DNA helicase Q1
MISKRHSVLRLLFLTPEYLDRNLSMQNALHELAKSKNLGGWVFDEAHCIVTWGAEFRPDYRLIGPLIRTIEERAGSRLPRMALTATATHSGQVRIADALNMVSPEFIRTSLDRPNIKYVVQSPPCSTR